MTQVLWLPPWPVLAILAGFAGLTLLSLWRMRREAAQASLKRQRLAVALRLVLLAALLVVAFNPTLVSLREQGTRPKLVVLVDASASMATADVAGQSRWAAGVAALEQCLADPAWRDRLDADVRTFGAHVAPAAAAQLARREPNELDSDLVGAIRQCALEQGDQPDQAGVLVLSDGRTTTAGAADAARLALARSTPLWTVALGGPRDDRNLRLTVNHNEILAFASDDVVIAATLEHPGYEQQLFNVELWRDGEKLQTIETTPDGTDGAVPGLPGAELPGAVVHFKVQAPAQGEAAYTLKTPAQPGEADASDNQQTIYVRAIGDRVRVLMVEAQPGWDSKFLVQSLKRSRRVDLTALYRLNAKRQLAVIASRGEEQRLENQDLFPRTAEAMDQYDVIILGREADSFFDEKTPELLLDYVSRRGGSVVFSRGKAYAGRSGVLSQLEPVVWDREQTQGVRPEATQAGEHTAVLSLSPDGDFQQLAERLPLLDAMQNTHGVKPLGVVLITGDAVRQDGNSGGGGGILMAYQPMGAGRVVTINADGLWRWAFGPKDGANDGQVYERFWLGLLRWLLSDGDFLAGRDVSIASRRRLYADNERVQLTVRLRHDDEQAPPTLAVRAAGAGASDDATMTLQPRREPALGSGAVAIAS